MHIIYCFRITPIHPFIFVHYSSCGIHIRCMHRCIALWVHNYGRETGSVTIVFRKRFDSYIPQTSISCVLHTTPEGEHCLSIVLSLPQCVFRNYLPMTCRKWYPLTARQARRIGFVFPIPLSAIFRPGDRFVQLIICW